MLRTFIQLVIPSLRLTLLQSKLSCVSSPFMGYGIEQAVILTTVKMSIRRRRLTG